MESAAVPLRPEAAGQRVVGQEEIRAYWTRQWSEFDPRVDPVEVIERGGGKVDVRVHQVAKSLAGDVLFDGEVWHGYTLGGGMIVRMDIGGEGASGAFSRG